MKFSPPWRSASGSDEARNAILSLSDYMELMSFYANGSEHIVRQSMGTGQREVIPTDFEGMVETVYKRSGVVFACMLARQMLFTEARFAFRGRRQGRPGDLFGTPELAVLEKPWTNGTTGELLARMDQDVSLAGNFYGVRKQRPDGTPFIKRLRPDWVTIIIGVEGAEGDPYSTDAEVVGYLYEPKGGGKAEFFLPEEMCHWSPIPDPTAQFRGMSWLTPVLREIAGDSAATTHKLKFFENGASPNMVVSLDPSVSADNFKKFKEMMDSEHKGYLNAWKTLYLGGGADVTPIGHSFKEMSFKELTSSAEARISAASGVPAIMVGLTPGLESATYSNFASARRKAADTWARPQWRSAAASLSAIVRVPASAELWYDDRDIPFLAADMADAGDLLAKEAEAINKLTTAGFDPDSVVMAVKAGDLRLLKGKHAGLFSVQLQKPGSEDAPPKATVAAPAADDPSDEGTPSE
jgi:phage portal protein BeeE